MLAPVVAVAPTTDVGLCYLVPPNPLPLKGDSLANWVVTNIDNNMRALLIAGAVGLIVVFFLWLKARGDSATADRVWVLRMAGTAVTLLMVWWLLEAWRDFDTKAHGYAAILMFVCLAAAIYFNSREPGHERPLPQIYLAIAGLMAAGILIPLIGLFGDHWIFALEAYEILLFAIYWLVQAIENWREEKIPEPASP